MGCKNAQKEEQTYASSLRDIRLQGRSQGKVPGVPEPTPPPPLLLSYDYGYNFKRKNDRVSPLVIPLGEIFALEREEHVF